MVFVVVGSSFMYLIAEGVCLSCICWRSAGFFSKEVQKKE